MNYKQESNSGEVAYESADALDSLLAQYVAGGLPVPVFAMMEAHIAIRPQSRLLVSELEALAGSELDAEAAPEIHDRETRLASIFDSNPDFKPVSAVDHGKEADIFPRALQDFVGYRAEEVPWRTKLPGFREHDIGTFDGYEAKLLWIRAGRAMPAHTHEGSELTLVLDGAFSDAQGFHERGDIAIADENVDHRPVAASGRPCICFAVTTAPLKLTGSFGQLFSDIFGR